jgi:DNA replication protein DnaC
MDKKVCPVCGGEGWSLVTSEGRVLARRCECQAKRRLEIIWEQARIPRRYQDCAFKSFHPENASQDNAMKIAKQFVKNYPVQDLGLLFIGPCGVGKTHLAVAVIRELIEKKGVGCVFYDFRDLIREIQGTFTPESSLSESDILAPVLESEILALDELGAKRPTAWVEETIFYIINQRFNQKRLTIFTTNYLDSEEEEDGRNPYFKKGEESLAARIGVRLRSRLYEMCWIVGMSGEDYRKMHKQDVTRF